MDIEPARRVFSKIRTIKFDRPERDEHHNLTDPLEVAAVAAGIRPAFLGGQSGEDAELFGEVASGAEEMGFLVWRGPGLLEAAELLAYDSPNIPRDYIECFLQRDLQQTKPQEAAYWLYLDPSVREQIVACEQGHMSVAPVLGYPSCCVAHFVSLIAKRHELQLEAYRREYGTNSSVALIDLAQRGVGVSIPVRKRIQEVDQDISRLVGDSIVQFPYVHFTACPPCIEAADSAAAKIHGCMRELAFTLDEDFAKLFEEYALSWRKVHEHRFGPIQRIWPGSRPDGHEDEQRTV